ncbi:dTDP-4-dehydrorhamnose reductase [Allomyces macrogynus ATCC 38327]|uniref:dTDP-4-dehydrorhamnose reductase n=1 Tax=Allomyces macrogynus (strain ATCC 38327) TaxID=578462 RepID=A0A0L0RVI0_ALLM3|nr:dTDP-4-dehydrorhamnose reductase [Allomyces macrogynus ATCC 38327]|eukprot:KNE54447.1 dTDP-4-dehydrorhamnose reductase [Allomyces macrogynus ATCC 38327]
MSLATDTRVKVLVTGASGLLGRAVMLAFQDPERSGTFRAVGAAFSRAEPPLVKVDLTSKKSVVDAFDQVAPQAVIHCAAERRPEVAEKDKDATTKLNVDSTRLLAEICAARGIFLVYISTDYVFDGLKPSAYDVEDVPNPLNGYGQSKRAGEIAVTEVMTAAGPNAKYAIMRVPVLYGEVSPTVGNKESAVNILMDVARNASAERPQAVDDVMPRYPTHVGDVARVLADLTLRATVKGELMHGIFHYSAEEQWTKYDMTALFVELLGMTLDHIERITTPSTDVTRPKHVKLSTKRLRDMGIDVTARSFRGWWAANL